jgi:hypothetical protein
MIIRRRVNSNYTIIPNAIINDERLSIEARWLMGYLLSKPDDWTIRAGDIQKVGRIGRNAAYALVNECIAVGYIRRYKQRDGGINYEVRDVAGNGGNEPHPQNREQEAELPFPQNGEQEQKCQIPESGNTENRDLSNYLKKLLKTELRAHDVRATPPGRTEFVREDDATLFRALERQWLNEHKGRPSMPRTTVNGYSGWHFLKTQVDSVRDSGGKVLAS